jgi:multiple sugar transport system permease protein
VDGLAAAAALPRYASRCTMMSDTSERLVQAVRRTGMLHLSSVQQRPWRRVRPLTLAQPARGAGRYLLLIVLALLFSLPLAWMLSTSLKNDAQTYHVPPIWLPWPLRFANYPEALQAQPFGLFFLNSMQYATSVVIGQLLSCSLAAYGFARLRWAGRNVLFGLCLATLMLPYQVTMVPLFITFKALGWVNTYRPLIVPAFFGSAYYIFLLRQFFLTIPQEITEAARIDGSSELGILARVVIPLARPALVVVALIEFLTAWDNYLGPLIYLNSERLYPLAIGLQLFRSDFVERLAWPYLMAATTVVMLPVIVLFFLAQRAFVEGITITGVRG